MKSKKLRIVIPLVIAAIITLGFILNLSIGTLCAPGLDEISLLCPLGSLMTMLASKTMIPRAVISLIIVILLIVLFARAFCGWICPVPVIEKLRGITKPKGKKGKQSKQVQEVALDENDDNKLTDKEKSLLKTSCGSCSACHPKRGNVPDTRHFVLLGALGSAAIFGFPVFCLVCPIGLAFASIFLIINLFAFGDVSWTVVVVPALLIIEVVVFKKWCHKICPIGALMSLIGKANKTFVPTIDNEKCLETAKGVSCGACGRACGEGIDIRHGKLSEASLSECTKCRSCVEACPTDAITMPFISRKGSASDASIPDSIIDEDELKLQRYRIAQGED